MLQRHLAEAHRNVAEGERHIVRQREIVSELERGGHDAKVALQLLWEYETLLDSHIADRNRIEAELAAEKRAH